MAALNSVAQPRAPNSRVTQNGLYLLAQDRLSTGGNFILCDACADRYPIRYASQGFGDLFGYTPSECLGKSCGDLVGSTAVRVSDPGFTRVAEASGLTPKQVATGIERQMASVGKQVQQLMAYPRVVDRMMFALVLNVAKNGDLRVIELVMMVRQLPVGWPYLVGIQHDVTDSVSIGQLLRAGLRNEIGELVESRQASICAKLAFLGTNTSQIKLFLHEKAVEVWRALLSAMPLDGTDDQLQVGSSQGQQSPSLVSLSRSEEHPMLSHETSLRGHGSHETSEAWLSPGSGGEAWPGESGMADFQSEVSFAYTAATTTLTTAFPLPATCHAAVQTDAVVVAPLVSTDKAEVEHSISDGSTPSKDHCFEPGVSVASANNARNVQLSGRPPKPYHVTLNTSKCVQGMFRETPDFTITEIIARALRLLNPRGRGCCFWHISLHVLKKQIFTLMRMSCKLDFKPCSDWQCGECHALQEIDEDAEDDDFDVVCSLCEEPGKVGQSDVRDEGHELESESEESLDSAGALSEGAFS